MFKYIYNMDGSREEMVSDVRIAAGTVISKGALIYLPLGTATLVGADFGTAPGKVPYGIALKASAATDTFTSLPVLRVVPNLSVLEADVDKVTAVITASSTSKTDIVDASVDGAANDELIGSVLEVISVADTTIPVGTLLTVTDYATGTGTFVHANAVVAAATTGFASGDTFKIKSLGQNIVGSVNLNVGAASDKIVLDGASATVATPSFRCVGVSDDGKKVQLVVVA